MCGQDDGDDLHQKKLEGMRRARRVKFSALDVVVLVLALSLVRMVSTRWFFTPTCPETHSMVDRPTEREGAEHFRKLLADIEASCARKPVYYQRRGQGKSLYYEIHQLAVALLKTTALLPDHRLVYHHVQVLDEGECTRLDCFFEAPPAACQVAEEAPMMLDSIDCSDNPVESIVSQLQVRSAMRKDHLHLYDWSFFIREAVNFIARPNTKLSLQIDSLKQGELKPLPGWSPDYGWAASRVGIHLDVNLEKHRQSREMVHRLVKGLEIYVSTHSGTGMDELLLVSSYKSSPEARQSLLTYLMSRVEKCETRSQQDLYARRKRYPEPIAWSCAKESASREENRVSMLAQAYILAETDVFVADFSKNYAKFVHMLMASRHHTHFPKVWDVRGFGFHEQFNSMEYDM